MTNPSSAPERNAEASFLASCRSAVTRSDVAGDASAGTKRIFLAGASGAVGRRLCLLLVREGWRVSGTTRTAEKADMLRALGVSAVIVDVFDAAGLARAVAEARPQIVIHQLTDLPHGLDPTKMAEAAPRNARFAISVHAISSPRPWQAEPSA